MSVKHYFNHYTCLVICLSLFCAPTQVSLAAPGVLSDVPLFLANRAQPNIFFLVDDSGSMHTELMTPEEIPTWGGIMEVAGNDFMYVFGLDNPPSNSSVQAGEPADRFYRIVDSSGNLNTIDQDNALPHQAWVDQAASDLSQSLNASQRGIWRSRSMHYNKQYYDPTVTYSPWVGNNYHGIAYSTMTDAVADVTTTPFNPYYFNPANVNSHVNLTTNWTFTPRNVGIQYSPTQNYNYYPAAYNAWYDTNSNGLVDPDDDYRRIEIRSTTAVCTTAQLADPTPEYTHNCMRRSYNDEIRNFATWFAFHRKREYVAKYALSQTINSNTNVRMGMMTIHNLSGTSQSSEAANERRPLRTMNASPTSGDKQTLLNTLYRMITNPSTPLVEDYKEVGDYFRCNSNPFGTGGTTDSCALQKTPAIAPPAACQQNFTVIVSDGDYRSPSNGFGGEHDEAGGTDNVTGTYYPDGSPVSVTFDFDGNPYEDSRENMADIAMDLYEKDLDTSITNRVPITCGIDENPMQHLVTYAIGFGIEGSIDPTALPTHPRRGYAQNCGETVSAASAFSWNTGATGAAANIDDVVHAAYNGRGKYFEADDPEELTNALASTFRNIANRTASSAAAAFNASVIASNTQIYLSQFNSTDWSGDLLAYALNQDGTVGSQAWSAATLLDARNIGYDSGGVREATDRAIVTFNPAAGNAVAFEWANLTAAQQNDLRTNASGGLEPGVAMAQARLNFIRGDRSCELGGSSTVCAASNPGATPTLRPRGSILGDLVNSTPIFVGRPFDRYPDTAPFGANNERYSDFKFGVASASGAFQSGNTAITRTPMLYVGGNDGMLHAFIADDSTDAGQELWSFIPNAVYAATQDAGLHKLAEQGYDHRYFVDLTPTVVDVYSDLDSNNNTDWHTVLIGGLRGGGKGYFAIDVTDPDYIRAGGTASARETRAASNVLWEFTAADDPDLGYAYSQPSVVPVGTSSGVEWFVVFGNGYESDNTASGSNPYSAKLFLLKLTGPGANGVWDIGTDYYKIDTRYPAGTAVAAADRNGLSTPALVDNNQDGIYDRAYAGDLYGNLWAFNLDGDPANNNAGWQSAYPGGNSAPQPLFIASGGDAGAGTRQAITMRPVVGRHPTVATVTSGADQNTPNIMVYFGTGQFLVQSDLNDTSIQTFYGVWDRGDSQRTVNRTTPASSTNHLVRQTIVQDTVTLADGGTGLVRYIDPDTNGDGTVNSSDNIDYSTKYGWFIDLPSGTGERAIFSPFLRGNLVFFNTIIPSQDPCGLGGSGWIMAVNANDGKSPSSPALDINRDGLVSVSDDMINGIAAVGIYNPDGLPGAGSLIAGNTPPPCDPANANCNPPPPPPCDPPKRPYLEEVVNSDGSVIPVLVCLAEGAKVGRYSWRELRFD